MVSMICLLVLLIIQSQAISYPPTYGHYSSNTQQPAIYPIIPVPQNVYAPSVVSNPISTSISTTEQPMPSIVPQHQSPTIISLPSPIIATSPPPPSVASQQFPPPSRQLPPQVIINVTMVFNMDYNVLRSQTIYDNFTQGFKTNLANMLNTSDNAIGILSLRPGSVVVDAVVSLSTSEFNQTNVQEILAKPENIFPASFTSFFGIQGIQVIYSISLPDTKTITTITQSSQTSASPTNVLLNNKVNIIEKESGVPKKTLAIALPIGLCALIIIVCVVFIVYKRRQKQQIIPINDKV